MSATRMVLVRTVPSGFHARVIAARLGAEGIVTELRGNVGGPYPFGEASVWVTPADAELAAALLLADEVEDAFAGGFEERRPVRLWDRRRLLAGAGLLLVAAGALAAHAGL